MFGVSSQASSKPTTVSAIRHRSRGKPVEQSSVAGDSRTDGRRDHCFETPFAMKFSSDRSSPSPVSAPDDDAPARHGDVETLRRLTREAFGEITSIRDRVRAVERNLATERASRASERVRVDTRAGRCWGVGHAGAVAATRPGLDCATTVEAPFPGGDSMTARFSTTTTAAVDDADAPAPSPYLNLNANVSSLSHAPTVTLEKLMYRKRVGRDGWIRLAPVGGEGQDAAATLNPFAPGRGVALTNLAAVGSPTLAECRGTALCASYDFADALFGVSGGIFSGEEPFEDGGYETRRLAQVTARPGTRAAMSLAVAEGPRRGARGFGMGAAGLFAVGERTLLSAWASTAKFSGASYRGYADEVDEDAGGWGLAATAPPKDVSRSSAGTLRDAVRGWGWGVVVGKEPGVSSPTQMEAFARIGDERGGGINERTVCPGIVVKRDADDGRWDVAAACRVEIKFS